MFFVFKTKSEVTLVAKSHPLRKREAGGQSKPHSGILWMDNIQLSPDGMDGRPMNTG